MTIKAPLAGQVWSPADYGGNAAFVPALGEQLLEVLAPHAGEFILDLGCGDGVLTERIRGMGAEVVGVDASAELLQVARDRSLDIALMDGQRLAFAACFDAVFSNAAIHWMRDHTAVAQGVFDVLKPGGRFVGEFGGHGNIAAIATALLAALAEQGIEGRSHWPWHFSDVKSWQRTLEAAGFAVPMIALMPRPTPLSAGMRSWLTSFADPFLTAIPTAQRETTISRVLELLEPSLCNASGEWTADYVRLRFVARKR